MCYTEGGEEGVKEGISFTSICPPHQREESPHGQNSRREKAKHLPGTDGDVGVHADGCPSLPPSRLCLPPTSRSLEAHAGSKNSTTKRSRCAAANVHQATVYSLYATRPRTPYVPPARAAHTPSSGTWSPHASAVTRAAALTRWKLKPAQRNRIASAPASQAGTAP